MNEQTAPLKERIQKIAVLHEALPHIAANALPAINWSDIEKYRPEVISSGTSSASDPLPAADVVIMTWTVAEWAALDHVFCDSGSEMHMSDVHKKSWQTKWADYGRNYYQIHQYMVDVEKTSQGGAPSLSNEAWGRYLMVKINGLNVLLVKSDMHLAQDGTNLPLIQFVEQICDEAKPKLLLSIGTAGGVRTEDALGSALVTNQAYFHLLKEFANADYNHTIVQSAWNPETAHIPAAQSRLIQVDGFPIYPVSPQYPDGAVIRPDSADSKIKVVTDEPIITTYCFLFGTTTNGLEKYGCIVEMDDAVVGMACRKKEVSFGFIRNVSDPVIEGNLPASLQDAWAGYIYKERGLFTSYNGALATWALMAGESDRD